MIFFFANLDISTKKGIQYLMKTGTITDTIVIENKKISILNLISNSFFVEVGSIAMRIKNDIGKIKME